MNIHVLSDVHLEFQRWRRNWDITSIACDAHVLAGDIGFGMMGLEFALGRFTKPVVYVCGNHEFYCRRTVSEWWQDARRKVANSHVYLLENEMIVIKGIRFLGTTLWVDFSLIGQDRQEQMAKHCAAGMTDFSRIAIARRNVARAALDPIESRNHLSTRLTWRTVAQWHQVAREFLERELPRQDDWDRTVVVTHHAPSIRGIEDPELPDRLDAGYATNLDHLIPQTDCWIHGHVHRADDYTGDQGGRVIRNARGYADTGYDSVDGFQWNRVVSL